MVGKKIEDGTVRIECFFLKNKEHYKTKIIT